MNDSVPSSYWILDGCANRLNTQLMRLRLAAFFNRIFQTPCIQPGHRVPRFSSMHWAVCVPKSCTPVDVEEAMTAAADRLSEGTGLKPTVRVNSEMCQIHDESGLPASTIFVG